jgi:hypothetical protein
VLSNALKHALVLEERIILHQTVVSSRGTIAKSIMASAILLYGKCFNRVSALDPLVCPAREQPMSRFCCFLTRRSCGIFCTKEISFNNAKKHRKRATVCKAEPRSEPPSLGAVGSNRQRASSCMCLTKLAQCLLLDTLQLQAMRSW